MSNSQNQIIPDVSLGLEHIRHYLLLADEQQERLHGQLRDKDNIEVSNRLGWLLDDVQSILADVQATLYPNDKQPITTNKGA